MPLTDRDVRPLAEWAEVLRSDLTRPVEGLIAAGLHLLEAKAQHPNAFVSWLSTAPFGFSQRHSYRLMETSENIRASIDLGYLPSLAILPAERSTLYELGRLNPDALRAAANAGEISPTMGRKEALAVVARYRTTPTGPLRIVPPEADEPGWLDTTPATFPTIAIDPPWQYDNTATRGAAAAHYATMTIAEICALDIPASQDAHLYLWVTNGFLRQGFELLEAWDFTYRTCLTWTKPQIGLGNYFRSATEHVLFGTKGTLPTNGKNQRNWFSANRRRHSAKPECFYDLVENVSPAPYLEMFARRRRLGWHVWGHES